jgi:Sulfotransferase family
VKYVRSRNPSFSLGRFPRPVVFTHIPKAAGTTLDRILNAITFYQQARWLRVSGTIYGQVFGSEKTEALDNYRRLSDRQLADVDVLTGHLPYGAHERLGRDCFKVTLLRDPVERCLSHYRFGLKRDGWSADRHVTDLFASGAMKDNGQCGRSRA